MSWLNRLLYLTFRVVSLMTRIMTSLPTAAPFVSWLAWLFISHLPCCVIDDPYYDLLADGCTFCVMTSLTLFLTFRVVSLMTRIMTSLPTAAPFASWLAWLFISHLMCCVVDDPYYDLLADGCTFCVMTSLTFISHLPCCVVDDPYYDLLANSCTFCVMTSLTFYFSPSLLCH